MSNKHFIDLANRVIRLHGEMDEYAWRQMRGELRSFCAIHGKNFSGSTWDDYIDHGVSAHALLKEGKL
jgi:hypothetical protein